MADYRFYRLSAGRILDAEVRDCASDEEAHRSARDILEAATAICDAIEIWQLARLVGTVRRTDPPQAA
ncbi:MAG TPA: hypothetical protein VLV50_18590 [Stellaceae bacterium]|nr:hypothetical protein [Stellaceae bacterium]